MSPILVVHASTHGHTTKVARRIASVFAGRGATINSWAVGDAGDRDPGAYDVVVVGGSIHRGARQHELVTWARAPADA